MKCRKRLYLTAASAALVGEGHEDAAILYATPGDEIPDSAADRFGLVDGALPDFEPEADEELAEAERAAAEKAAPTPANKEDPAPADKGAPAPPSKPKAPAKAKAAAKAT